MSALTDAEAVRIADRNYAHSFRLLGRHAVGGRVYEEPGMLSAITGTIPWLNATVIYERLAAPGATIRRAIDFYRDGGAPFVVRIRAGFEPETQTAMQKLGLRLADQLPGMVLNPIGEVPPVPSDLKIVDCDAGSLAAHQEVIATSFGMPLSLAHDLLTPGLLDGGLRGYVGYVDGRAVVTSALIESDGVAGVYNVATLPEYRKRGLGEAMTWHAVREGLMRGCVIGSLQASEMGRPVYARMGFRDIARYETYVLPAQP